MSDDALTIEDVRRLSPESVRDKIRSGELDHLLGIPDRRPKPPPLNPAEVERAAEAGTLDELLERHRNWTPTLRDRLQHMSPEEIRAALPDLVEELNRGEVQ